MNALDKYWFVYYYVYMFKYLFKEVHRAATDYLLQRPQAQTHPPGRSSSVPGFASLHPLWLVQQLRQ